MKNKQTVVVLDFGGQYRQLIARRVRECKVYSVILPGDTDVSEIQKINPIGIILTGGPNSVYDPAAPKFSTEILKLNVPVLGICYGMQALAYSLGGVVESCKTSEFGKLFCTVDTSCKLFEGLDAEQIVLMSHTDRVTKLPKGFKRAAFTEDCPNAAAFCESKRLYATQFHPEVTSTVYGKRMIKNFLYGVCGATGDYTMKSYRKELVSEIRKNVGDKKVILGLSGGLDSSVCAALLAEAVPGQTTCIFVDHGMMRKGEGDEVEGYFKDKEVNFVRVNAKERFLSKLKGVVDPEQKRKIIGEEFVRVFEEESAKHGDATLLAQGTIYSDVVESGGSKSATIKTHHNVGGLPTDMRFTGLVEPLRKLFKDEVRTLGRRLGLPEALITRQPFPGPGLAVRIMGEITEEKLRIVSEVDAIFRDEAKRRRLKADQFFAVLTNTRSVGVVGDYRVFGYTVALRAILTSDFMTCEAAPISTRALSEIANRIINSVKGVARVVYDVTGKPPATIEWE